MPRLTTRDLDRLNDEDLVERTRYHNDEDVYTPRRDRKRDKNSKREQIRVERRMHPNRSRWD